MATIDFTTRVLYLTEHELIDRLFPHLPFMIRRSITVTRDGAGFHFQMGEITPDDLEKLWRYEWAPPGKPEILEENLANLEPKLSTKAINVLRSKNIHTLKDVVSRTKSEILSYSNMGRVSIKKLDDLLYAHNLVFKDEEK